MSCVLRPAPDSPLPLLPAQPRPMTRCECAGIAFAEIARQLVLEGRALEHVLGRTGCGQTCGACLPDLAVFVAAARLARPAAEAAAPSESAASG